MCTCQITWLLEAEWLKEWVAAQNQWGSTAVNYWFIMILIVPVEFSGNPCATSYTAHYCGVAAWYVCAPLFKRIQRTAIVSSGHPWLLRSILCQPLGMLAKQRLVDYQQQAGFPGLEHIHVREMCHVPRPWIIILPTSDPGVAMATVSVIVSMVLTGCSHGNNVCNRGLVQIKLFRNACMWGTPDNGRVAHAQTHTLPAQTYIHRKLVYASPIALSRVW